jgi:hypothetical protein
MNRILLGALAASALAFGCQRNAQPHVGSSHSAATDQAVDRNVDRTGAVDQGTLNNQAADQGNNQAGAGVSGAASNANGTATQSRDVNSNVQPRFAWVAGTVKDTAKDSITVTTVDQGDVKLDLDQGAQLFGPDNKPISSGDIKQGEDVRASYMFDGQKNVARRVQIEQVK